VNLFCRVWVSGVRVAAFLLWFVSLVVRTSETPNSGAPLSSVTDREGEASQNNEDMTFGGPISEGEPLVPVFFRIGYNTGQKSYTYRRMFVPLSASVSTVMSSIQHAELQGEGKGLIDDLLILHDKKSTAEWEKLSPRTEYFRVMRLPKLSKGTVLNDQDKPLSHYGGPDSGFHALSYDPPLPNIPSDAGSYFQPGTKGDNDP